MMKWILSCGLILSQLMAQTPPETALETELASSAADDGVRVSVLGYHDFTAEGEETEMCIRTAKFRRQMEQIQQLGIKVVSLDDFAAWKRGEKAIPERSILITVDDGWKSFYTEAYPILKEFKYPFTLYLYKNYVDGGGRAMTSPMIKEMLNNGATIGSHSVSHPYPIAFKKMRREGEDAYDKFLRKELGESKRFLESRFRTKVTTYSYPGGYVTKEMLPLAEEFRYQLAFTTKPGKAKRSDPDLMIPRFMILGNYDRIFEFATSFGDSGKPETASAGPIQSTAQPVAPAPGSIINSRLPLISADLSQVEGIDPDTLEMRVSGFAKVPAKWDPETKKLSWQTNRKLRQPTCQVLVKWRNLDGEAPKSPLQWSFQIDREAAYLSDGE